MAKSQHRRSQRASKGHESDIGDRPVVSRSHTERPHPTLRTQSGRVTLFTYASQGKHGQHYRSCATEWAWREDENRTPYKRPEAILEANPKNQLNYQPTIHTERKLVTCIIWMGMRDQDEPKSHTTTTHTTPTTWRAEGELFTYASQDEPGQHYRSCATEWGWREDENRPPYKRPKAIVQANPKTQLDHQPTFHTERKPIPGIIWRGTRGPR